MRKGARWKNSGTKREQQLQRGVKSLVGLYGDLQGIIGSALQPVTKLELPSGNLELFDE